ncbi:MAG: ribose 5-phosphate isomerase B [Acidobacteriota bacterium]
MKIVIAADHAGFELKEYVKDLLLRLGHEVTDEGTHSTASVDYPDYADRACETLLSGAAERAVLVCGSGVGMSMAANRHRGIRAVLCTGLYLARFSRLHNDSNVLCLPGRLMGKGLAEEVVKTWLEAPFEGGRHLRRIAKLDNKA